MNHYRVELPVFNGPLDLLLHLIEREELDIAAVSLAQVTGQYLEQVRQLGEDQIEGLIDFISIGARLLLIKSRALLPRPVALPDGDDEEDPAEALLRQLRDYKRFKAVALWLDERRQLGLRTYLRVAPPPRLDGRLDLSGVDAHTLLESMRAVLSRVEAKEESLQVARPRQITIEDQMSVLRGRLSSGRSFHFTDIVDGRRDNVEVAVTFLALLELIKRREAQASQSRMFGPIEITVFK